MCSKFFAPAVLMLAIPLGGGCGNDVTAPGSRAESPALAAFGAFSPWSIASSIEIAPPGADPSFNLPAPTLDGCPFISRDGKTFYIASNRAGTLGGIDIWVSTRASVDEPWGAPVNVGEPVNSSVDDFCPTIGRDGHTLYFVSRRQTGVQGHDWCGGADIYVTRLRDGGGFEEPTNLGCSLNSAADEFSPFPLPERASGPVLYFSSTRPRAGAIGGDLYVSESHGGVFGPAQLVPVVNSDVDDGQPNVRADGLELFFYSRRQDLSGSQGGADLHVATRTSVEDAWSTPVNLGSNVNSPADETRPSLSWTGTILYFGSTRAGSADIYLTTREGITGPAD